MKLDKDINVGYVHNCVMYSRDSDGPMFHIIDGKVLSCLDGYLIAPVEDYQEFMDWKERKSRSKIRVLNLGGK